MVVVLACLPPVGRDDAVPDRSTGPQPAAVKHRSDLPAAHCGRRYRSTASRHASTSIAENRCRLASVRR